MQPACLNREIWINKRKGMPQPQTFSASVASKFALGPTASAEPRPKRWSRREYESLVETGVFEGQRLQLIHGEVLEMSPQGADHAAAVGLATRALLRIFGEGYWIRDQLPLRADETSLPEPDLAIVEGEPRDYREQHPARAVLIVEIASTSLDFDRKIKAPLYAQMGVEDFWIVNLVDRCVEVYRQPSANGYEQCEVFGADREIVPAAASKAAVRVADLLP